MKKSTIITSISLIALLCLALISYGASRNFDSTRYQTSSSDFVQQTKAVYTCPMHSEIVQDKAGKCPKCGMNLVVKQEAKELYTCPMHSEVVQDKAGKCPKCGMALVKKEVSKFTCPMHSEVIQDKAGKCPKCGMNLVLKSSENKNDQVKK
jgi:ssDNA-binding Zn-finger/Zn-ribbon topoisomerase 1